jgi:ectoine hydroxylase-related dioxygenase (phytanoyl-CoA dioxygenase family)
MSETTEYGVFYGILPSQPTITPSQLLEACQAVAASEDYALTWTHHRESSLIHPALHDPLRFLEISGKLNLDDKENLPTTTIDELCQHLATALEDNCPAIIGSAELLLVLDDTPIPLCCPSAVPMIHTVESQIEVETAKSTFNQYGLVGLTDAVDNVDDLYSLALETFERLYAALQLKANSNNHTKHFREIMQRDDNRFDFRLDLSDNDAVWKDVERSGRWKTLVAAILGDDYSLVKCGCVLSLPGAGMQYYHSDGVHIGQAATFDSEEAAPTHALCVFVPLIDLNHQVGFTEFWAGSHRYDKLLAKKGEQALPGGTDGILKRGDCLLYDYRTIHRGTANTSQITRPVCYFLYSKRGMEDVEDQNFTSASVFD